MPNANGTPTLAELLAADSASSGGSGRAPDTGQIIRDPYDGNYYRVMDNGDVIPIDIPGKTDAPAFDNYGGAQYTGIDGPRGAVYRASNGDYVYGDQVFKSWPELKSLLDASSAGGADTSKFKQGNDGQYYELGSDGQFHLVPGMPADIANRNTSIQNIGGMATLVDTQTGEIIKVIGPSGSGSSSGGSGGGSSAGLISGRSTGVNTNTGSLVSSSGSSSGYDQMAAQQAQRDWQTQQSALDRAQRAQEFAATYGLQAANYQLSVRDRADSAAKTYGELVSSADTAALPAYLAAGGGNLWNALATNNSMLTDNAIKPGAMALDNARWYQDLLGGSSGGNSTGGGAMSADPFNPNSPPAITPTPDTPVTQGYDTVLPGTVGGSANFPAQPGGGPWAGPVGPNWGGGGNRGGGGLGGGAYGRTSGGGGRANGVPHFATMPSYSTNPMQGWGPDAAAAAFSGYEQAQQMQYDQNQPQQSYGQAFPTMYPGATFWQNGQLMYQTGSGPVPASMIDPYTMSAGTQGYSPYASNAHLPDANQQAVAADPRSINPNLNLSPQAQNTNYVRQTPVASSSLRGYSGTMPNGQRVVNGVPQGPSSVAPNVARFANGGMINGMGIVGDSPSGRRTGHEELVFAPRGAMVFPLNKVQGHAKGGAIDPFAVAGSSTSAADPLFNTSTSEGEPTPMTSAVETPTPIPATGASASAASAGAMMAGMQGGYGMGAGTSWAQPVAQSPIQQAANPQPAPVASNESDQGAGTSGTPAATTGNGFNIVNGPNYVPPGTAVPTGLSEEEVRRWREGFPIPEIMGPNGVLNPFDVAWQNVDPTARSVFYNANQTRYGIPAASQQWEASRYALPGAQRGGWGY